jgi:hypothetical protein
MAEEDEDSPSTLRRLGLRDDDIAVRWTPKYGFSTPEEHDAREKILREERERRQAELGIRAIIYAERHAGRPAASPVKGSPPSLVRYPHVWITNHRPTSFCARCDVSVTERRGGRSCTGPRSIPVRKLHWHAEVDIHREAAREYFYSTLRRTRPNATTADRQYYGKTKS